MSILFRSDAVSWETIKSARFTNSWGNVEVLDLFLCQNPSRYSISHDLGLSPLTHLLLQLFVHNVFILWELACIVSHKDLRWGQTIVASILTQTVAPLNTHRERVRNLSLSMDGPSRIRWRQLLVVKWSSKVPVIGITAWCKLRHIPSESVQIADIQLLLLLRLTLVVLHDNTGISRATLPCLAILWHLLQALHAWIQIVSITPVSSIHSPLAQNTVTSKLSWLLRPVQLRLCGDVSWINPDVLLTVWIADIWQTLPTSWCLECPYLWQLWSPHISLLHKDWSDAVFSAFSESSIVRIDSHADLRSQCFQIIHDRVFVHALVHPDWLRVETSWCYLLWASPINRLLWRHSYLHRWDELFHALSLMVFQ